MTVVLARAGFRATGIFLLNSRAIPEKAFVPSSASERVLTYAAAESQLPTPTIPVAINSNSQPNESSAPNNASSPVIIEIISHDVQQDEASNTSAPESASGDIWFDKLMLVPH